VVCCRALYLPIYSYDAPIPRLIATLLILKGLLLWCSTLDSNQFPCHRKVYIFRSLENSVSISLEPNSKFDEVYLLKEGFDFCLNPMMMSFQKEGFDFLKFGQGRTLRSSQEMPPIEWLLLPEIKSRANHEILS